LDFGDVIVCLGASCILLSGCGRLGYDFGAESDGGIPGNVGGDSQPGDGVDGALPVQFDCDPAVALCESFEDGLAGWTSIGSGDVVEAVSEPSYSPPGSLHAYSVSGRAAAFAQASFAPSSSLLYARAYVNLVDPADVEAIEFLRLGSGGGAYVGVAGGVPRIVVGQGEPAFGAQTLPANEWFCLSVIVSPDELRVAVDGSDETVWSGATGVTTYSVVAAGIVADPGNPDSFEVYIDDVAVSEEPLPCP
jgi:hypothetical protein